MFWSIAVLCAPALIVATAGLLAGLAFLSRVRLPGVHRRGTVSLILPLTGPAEGLGKLLRAIEAQTLKPRRVLICVEGMQDPAYLQATRLAATVQVPVDIVIAQQATRCPQKCSTQMAGLARIDADDNDVVFLDADILPPNWWLSALATPVLDGSADIVTGYRWPVFGRRNNSTPLSTQLAFHLTAAIDRGIALLPRLGAFQTTWGGSLALSPRALERLGGDQVIGNTLSDDCTIGSRAATLGLRVLTRSALLVPTPADNGLAALCRFGRRQYQIIRVYRPHLWWLAFFAQSSRLTAWVVIFLNTEQWWARLSGLALLFFALAGVWVQAGVAQRLGLGDSSGVTLLQMVVALMRPAVDLLHWALVLAACNPRTIRWGHITYRVDGPEKIAVIGRSPWR